MGYIGVVFLGLTVVPVGMGYAKLEGQEELMFVKRYPLHTFLGGALMDSALANGVTGRRNNDAEMGM